MAAETPILPPGFAARAAQPVAEAAPEQPSQIKQAAPASPAPADLKVEMQDSTMTDVAPEAPNPVSSIAASTTNGASPAPPARYPTPTPQRLTETTSRATSQQPEKVEAVPAPTVAVLHGAPVRQYLNSKVTASVLEGMKQLAREQPNDPLRWLSEFLMERSREFEGTGA